MATYAISFNLRYDNSKSYDERYDSLMAEIRKCTTVWTETTSFALVESNEALDALERRLWLTKFDSSQDILLVIDVSYDDATIRGAAAQKDKLRKLLYGIGVK